MRSLTLSAANGLSLPVDSYVYRIAAVDQALAIISSDDSLRVFDPTTLQLVSGGIHNNIHTGVTCLETTESGGNSLFTAGRDGFIRSWDLRTGGASLKISDAKSTPLLSLALANDGHMVAAGTELAQSSATVQIWDNRSPVEPITRYVECHNDDVTELSYHPTQSTCLLSGSTDGLVNIYNSAISDEDDSLMEVFNHGASVSHAGFLDESTVFALSHDETLSIYDMGHDRGFENRLQNSVPFGDLRSRLGCEYVVDVLPLNSGAIIGAGVHSASTLNLVPLKLSSSWTVDNDDVITLPGAHGEEIIRTLHIDSHTSTVYTGGEDGMVRAWRPGRER